LMEISATLCCHPADTFWADGTQDDDEICLHPRLIFPGGGGRRGGLPRVALVSARQAHRLAAACLAAFLRLAGWILV
jgi:hypothetical protein